MKTLIATYADISYNPSLKSVELTWIKFADTEPYKQILEQTLDVVRETKCSVWVSDMSNGKTVTRESIEWLRNVFVPKAVKLGVRKMGFLVTGNAFAKLHAVNLKAATKQYGIEMNYFERRYDLDMWILS